jgi:hypothetical protein
MRGEGLGFQRAVIIPAPDRCERFGIDLVGKAVLLGHEQAAGMPDGRGVRHRALDPLDFRVVGKRVAIFAEQGAPRGFLGLVARGFDVADREIHLAVADGEFGDHAVARKDDLILELGRVGRVGHGAEKGAVDFRGSRRPRPDRAPTIPGGPGCSGQ